jgi:hypothetical protein
MKHPDCEPSDLVAGTTEEIEEERRLLYVAMTRAKNDLHLLVRSAFTCPTSPTAATGICMRRARVFCPIASFRALSPNHGPSRSTNRFPVRWDQGLRSTLALACEQGGVRDPGNSTSIYASRARGCIVPIASKVQRMGLDDPGSER